MAFDLMIANTSFRKRESYLVTYRIGHSSSQIDFVLTRRGDRHACVDCKVIPSECVVSQHKLVVAAFWYEPLGLNKPSKNKVVETRRGGIKGLLGKSY
jgi:hypothetical protein